MCTLLQLQPNITDQWIKQSCQCTRRAHDAYLEGLRKAGLPERTQTLRSMASQRPPHRHASSKKSGKIQDTGREAL